MNAPTATHATVGLAESQVAFLDQPRALTDLTGLAPSVAKVFLWLVVCEPPQQTTEPLRQTLGLSAAAISTATATLAGRGLVERVSFPWERHLSYRLPSPRLGAIHALPPRSDISRAHNLRHRARVGNTTQPRLADLRAIYAWFETQITELLADHTTGSLDPGA
jgi:hypothetical protein